jgi:hypothetical protein
MPRQLALSLAPKWRRPKGSTPPGHPPPRGLGRQKSTQIVPDLNQGRRYAVSKITLFNQTASPNNCSPNVNFSPKESNTRRRHTLAAVIAPKAKPDSEILIDRRFTDFHWKSARFSPVIGFGKALTATLLATGSLHELVGNPEI